MKFLSRLENKNVLWSLIGLCLLFIILRLPSLLEPYWYGDEGIYHVIGQAINNGAVLYRDIWDNKPPLLYLIYALANGDQILVRSMSLTIGIVSVIIFFLLSYKLFASLKISTIITFIYVILFGSPILEGNIANAENFILLPVMAAALYVLQSTEKRNSNSTFLTLAGLLLGIAFLLKIVAIFDLAAFSLFLFLLALPRIQRKAIIKAARSIISLIIGFALPFFVTTVYFFTQGIGVDYFQSVFARNVDYVGFENTLFGIPQGLLILKIVLLIVSLALVIWKRNAFSKKGLFIILWLIFALFSANFSGRPYTHYVLVLLPSFCLLLGFAFLTPFKRRAKVAVVGCVALVSLILLTFPTYGIGKTVAYYHNTYTYLIDKKDMSSYQAFFDTKTPRDYTLASFLSSHTTDSDKIFIWGDSAQIYTLAHKLPLYKYTVSYHVKDSPELLQETQTAIDTVKPKYIVVLPESQPLPFSLPLYIIRFNVEGALIYERSF